MDAKNDKRARILDGKIASSDLNEESRIDLVKYVDQVKTDYEEYESDMIQQAKKSLERMQKEDEVHERALIVDEDDVGRATAKWEESKTPERDFGDEVDTASGIGEVIEKKVDEITTNF